MSSRAAQAAQRHQFSPRGSATTRRRLPTSSSVTAPESSSDTSTLLASSPGDAIRSDDKALEELLLAVLPPDPLTGPRQPERPAIPLAASALLVNGPDQPRIGRELPLELATADRVELICGFIKWEGLRTIRDALEAAAARGVPVSAITTTYLGATDGEPSTRSSTSART